MLSLEVGCIILLCGMVRGSRFFFVGLGAHMASTFEELYVSFKLQYFERLTYLLFSLSSAIFVGYLSFFKCRSKYSKSSATRAETAI